MNLTILGWPLNCPQKYIISQLLHSHSVSSVSVTSRGRCSTTGVCPAYLSLSLSIRFHSLNKPGCSCRVVTACQSLKIHLSQTQGDIRWHIALQHHTVFLTVISPDVQFSNLIFLFFATTSVRFSDTEAQYPELEHKIKGRKL